jgi:hypothetical protein
MRSARTLSTHAALQLERHVQLPRTTQQQPTAAIRNIVHNAGQNATLQHPTPQGSHVYCCSPPHCTQKYRYNTSQQCCNSKCNQWPTLQHVIPEQPAPKIPTPAKFCVIRLFKAGSLNGCAAVITTFPECPHATRAMSFMAKPIHTHEAPGCNRYSVQCWTKTATAKQQAACIGKLSSPDLQISTVAVGLQKQEPELRCSTAQRMCFQTKRCMRQGLRQESPPACTSYWQTCGR